MSYLTDLYGYFTILTPSEGYISVNPEFRPEDTGISPTGRYHVFYADPVHGSCTFVVEQDDHCNWVCEIKPPFVSDEFVNWVADRIEYKTK